MNGVKARESRKCRIISHGKVLEYDIHRKNGKYDPFLICRHYNCLVSQCAPDGKFETGRLEMVASRCPGEKKAEICPGKPNCTYVQIGNERDRTVSGFKRKETAKSVAQKTRVSVEGPGRRIKTTDLARYGGTATLLHSRSKGMSTQR